MTWRNPALVQALWLALVQIRRDGSLIAIAKLNDIDPQAWLADVLRRINDYPASRLDELRPWNWRKPEKQAAVAA